MTINLTEQTPFFYDGYQDAKAKVRYNPPEKPELAKQYRDGWEEYIFETNQFARMTEQQLGDYIKTSHRDEQYGPEYENATRIFNSRFSAE